MRTINTYWEYKTLICREGLESLQDKLNVLGSERWEAYHIDCKNEGLLGTYTVFLKREV